MYRLNVKYADVHVKYPHVELAAQYLSWSFVY